MKPFILIILVLISIFNVSFAQIESNFSKTNNYINAFATDEVKFNESVRNIRYKDCLGSPYLTDSFTVGSIYTGKNEHLQNIPIRYNIYTDNIEYIMGASSVLELKNPETVEKVEYGNYKLIYLSQSDKMISENGFFIVLTEGNATLLLKPAVTLHKPTQAGGYNDAQPPRFSRNPDTYYIKVGKTQPKIIKNKKQLINSFPDYRAELSNFIKTNNTKISDQKSLTAFVQYYNSF